MSDEVTSDGLPPLREVIAKHGLAAQKSLITSSKSAPAPAASPAPC